MIKYEKNYAEGGLVSSEPSGAFRGRGAAKSPNSKKKVDPMDDLNVKPVVGVGYSGFANTPSPRGGKRKKYI